MGELLWTCEGGTTFCSESNGLRLTVIRAPGSSGYRYQLLRPMLAEASISLASGHRDELREAMEAAERSVHGLVVAGLQATPPG